MTTEKGKCKHGEFFLGAGCPKCIAECIVEAREQKTMERLTGIGEEVDRSTDELEEGLNSEGLTLKEPETSQGNPIL